MEKLKQLCSSAVLRGQDESTGSTLVLETVTSLKLFKED